MGIRISTETLYAVASTLLARVDAARAAGQNPVDCAFEAVGILRGWVEGETEHRDAQNEA